MVGARNPNFVETQVAVVHADVPKLFAEVADLNARQGPVVLQGADLDKEWLDSVVRLVDDQTSKYYRMRRLDPDRAGPEFGRCDSRCVDHELICRHVECRCRLEIGHVGAVAELCLAVASNDVQVQSLRQPYISLLLARESLQALDKHCTVQMNRRRARRICEVRLKIAGFVDFAKHLRLKLHHLMDKFPPHGEFLFLRHAVVLERLVEHLWMLLEELLHLFDLSVDFV